MHARKQNPLRSFSYRAKDEICTREIAEGTAELTGMLLAAASFDDAPGACRVRLTTENLPVAKRLVQELSAMGVHGPSVSVRHNANRHTYTVTVSDAGPILEALHIAQASERQSVPPECLRTEEQRTALLRGAFLACGSISNPRKNYHLELAIGDRAVADTLRGILSEFSIRSNVVPRKEHFVLYLNEGDSITALLALIGAHTSILNLENVRILKETRNNVNRAVNCETANINKTVNAAQKQVDSIRIIERKIGLGQLSRSLREAAELRLEHPEASLQELCELCGTTKSGMNHRLRKINAIARSLAEEV